MCSSPSPPLATDTISCRRPSREAPPAWSCSGRSSCPPAPPTRWSSKSPTRFAPCRISDARSGGPPAHGWWRSPAAPARPPPRTRSPPCSAARYRVVKNRGNLNNHLGLPISLVELRTAPDVAVMELGMNHAGEIRVLVGVSRARRPGVDQRRRRPHRLLRIARGDRRCQGRDSRAGEPRHAARLQRRRPAGDGADRTVSRPRRHLRPGTGRRRPRHRSRGPRRRRHGGRRRHRRRCGAAGDRACRAAATC